MFVDEVASGVHFLARFSVSGNMVVHFMLPATREVYELEKLWTLRTYDEQLRSMPAETLPEDFIYDAEVTKWWDQTYHLSCEQTTTLTLDVSFSVSVSRKKRYFFVN